MLRFDASPAAQDIAGPERLQMPSARGDAEIRERFELVDKDRAGRRRIFFDSAAGSLVLKEARAAIADAAHVASVGGATFADSAFVDSTVERARDAVDRLIRTAVGSVVASGESTTAQLRRLAECLAPRFPRGSRVLVTACDHNANVDPWRASARESDGAFEVALVRHGPDGRIDLDDLAEKAAPSTALLAVSHASNVLGVENPIGEIVAFLRSRAREALVVVDGVHAIPHFRPDLEAWDADAYVFSCYKLFAQRGLSFLALGPRLLSIEPYRLEPAPQKLPKSWETGSRNAADFAPVLALEAYLAWLGEPHGKADPRRDPYTGAYAAIAAREAVLATALLEGTHGEPGLAEIPGVRVHGPGRYIGGKEPTVSFTAEGIDPESLERRLWEEDGIAVRSGTHYAPEALHQAGDKWSVRASLAHYNTLDEVAVFLRAVNRIVGRIS